MNIRKFKPFKNFIASPGNNGNRIVLSSPNSGFIGNGNSIFSYKFTEKEKENEKECENEKVKESKNKESDFEIFEEPNPHGYEIQTISLLKDSLVGSIDGQGEIIVRSFNPKETSLTKQTKQAISLSGIPKESEEIPLIEGHADLKFGPPGSNILFSSLYWTKHICLFDLEKETCVRAIHAQERPTGLSVGLQQGQPILYSLEGQTIAMYDQRSKYRSGCFRRVKVMGSEPLISIDGNANQVCVGSGRSLLIYDVKKMSLYTKLTNCMKWEINHICVTKPKDLTVWCAGIGQQVKKLKIQKKTKKQDKNSQYGTLLESRILGFDLYSDDNNQDTVASFVENGTFYFISENEKPIIQEEIVEQMDTKKRRINQKN
ncbi:hypothetical protein M0813_18472 [Anaeramoeba flamelloides]|uniref:Uncharacterized protein n=1 Tax=Anaeramoeba flamelloides TaxID=1746091 RepID=A0AAV7Z369_9EUKA|nr:hypothetical protein M0812_19765 [Anaeramoeba flamelloides]KAJ6247837.1 hypothetical protein M0813_18472 [Anaeramoeba flamelloides]